MASIPDPLDPILDRWRSHVPPAPTADALSREVWRRIADAEASAAETTFLSRVEATFSQPSFAFAFVAACTLFGLFLAEVKVSRQQTLRNVQIAQAYIQLIDPLLDENVAPASDGLPQHNAP